MPQQRPATLSVTTQTPATNPGSRSFCDFGELAGTPGTITIRPCPLSIYDKPYVLAPLRFISRARLSLAYFDPTQCTSSLPTTRLFTARIPLFQNIEANCDDPKILIASIHSETCLFAVESVQPSVYALCRLATWVTTELLDSSESQIMAGTVRGIERCGNDPEGHWWGRASLKRRSETDLSKASIEPKRLKLTMLKAPVSKLGSNIDYQERQKASRHPGTQDERSPLREVDGNVKVPQTAEEVFESLMHQYLETLYSARPFAFFAKGSLSRARAAFGAGPTPDMPTSDLISFLRSMVMKPETMSRKYKERLPEIIKDLPVLALSDDESREPLPSRKKRKKPKRPKLSREGTYLQEQDYVRQWWHSQNSSTEAVENIDTAEKRLRRRLAELQTRETLAQIIIIMETLALEDSLATEEASLLGAVQLKDVADSAVIQLKAKKQKKPQDLCMLLELLMDKLSIWQSIESLAEFGDKGQPDRKRESTAKPADRDFLASFCNDVINPFYMGRIPKMAELLNSKFLGTVVPHRQSTKPRRQREAQVNSDVRDSQRNPRRTLSKTTSDPRAFARKTSLVRSATDSSLLTSVKLEPCDSSFASIPTRDSMGRASREPSVQLKHLNRRQINLNAIAAATEEKLKKKAKVEEELRNAISTLRKPNRAAAVRELADAGDLRISRNGRTGGRQAVQVGATPSHNRTKDFFSQPALQGASAVSASPYMYSSPVIAASAMKPPSMRPAALSQPIFTSSAQHVIAATPSRGLAKKSDVLATPTKSMTFELAVPSSASEKMYAAMSRPALGAHGAVRPVLSAFASIPSVSTPVDTRTSSTSDRRGLDVCATSQHTSLPGKIATGALETRILDVDGGTVPQGGLPNGGADQPLPPEDSIYDALGWNDDGVDDLAY